MKIPYNIGDAGAQQEKLWQILNDMAADLEALKNAMQTHTHGGVTAGTDSTAVTTTTVTLKTIKSDNYTG
ncbi:hypothetical protein D2962_08175 [Biomaibacter acetigenes]|uniref:Uncharacterized protein n=1 Tax=Biomaibacter acetigenes TaxID=2316383 RepID=A0A3G2R5E1_9FIRM|nr:hypothetical protein [Biomaibacter acetigenes]AYO30599.1 hypothetical protein D2962_08175 [Biomaibacter acetigenes]